MQLKHALREICSAGSLEEINGAWAASLQCLYPKGQPSCKAEHSKCGAEMNQHGGQPIV